MSYITLVVIGGFALIILATLWNILVQNQGPKEPSKLYAYFIKTYGFTKNEQATIFTGIYKERNIQLNDKPPSTIIPLSNTKGIKLRLTTLSEEEEPELAEVKGYPIKIYSNYPHIIQDVLTDEIISSIQEATPATYDLDEALIVRWEAKLKRKELEELLSTAITLVRRVETFNAHE